MPFNPLNVVSPIDGRYGSRTEKLGPYFSEQALMSYRIRVEVEYLISLSKLNGFGPESFSDQQKEQLRNLADLSDEQASIIKQIETTGYENILRTKHDVKAIEYYMQLRCAEISGLTDIAEWLHFGLTSEDTNNLSYALMLRDAVEQILLPTLNKILAKLATYAEDYAELAMLARTHGQSASPTTFGKEIAVFHNRIKREVEKLSHFVLFAKINGATGNYNALTIAAPSVDWVTFSKDFIADLNTANSVITLEANLLTTQIEPHDTYVELFQILSRINVILIDFNQDMWRYISDGWVTQKPVEGEIGSSTMPHKVNPIDFENSEGNLGLANALFSFFGNKLPISRLQRDLSDSTVERNFGSAFAYTLIGYESLLAGLTKISPNSQVIEATLAEHAEVLAEAFQTILRREGAVDAYEKLMAFTRGKKVTMEDFSQFISTLSVSESRKK